MFKNGRIMEDVILFIDENRESEKALAYLQAHGVKFKVIDVRKNGIRGWLLLEFGSTKAPILVTSKNIIYGFENIINFIKNISVS